MKKRYYIFSICLVILTSCSTEESNDNSLIFEDFWKFVDENYIFFNSKEIDWDSVYDNYKPKAINATTKQELFTICSDALLELKDGHSVLISEFATSPVYDYTTGFDIHFSLEVVASYFTKPLIQNGFLHYTTLDNIGYIYFEKINNYNDFIPIVRKMYNDGIKGLIIDIRNNGGGNSNPLPKMLSNFVTKKTALGAYVEKTGPNENDITEPLTIFTEANNNAMNIPIVMLTNRNSYSAASYFAAMVAALPNSTLIGQKTGGGSGGNYGYQLNNGWIVKVSVSDFYDVNGKTIELGVEPDIEVENTEENLMMNVDDMLNKAIEKFGK